MGRRGVLAQLLARSQALRFAYALFFFIPVVPATLLLSAFGSLDGMLAVWRLYSAALGLAQRVHGALPPADEPAVWVSNHFNWFDYPVLQRVAPYKLHAVVKADIAVESSLVGGILHRWCRNLGAIFYTRGDRKSGAVWRARGARVARVAALNVLVPLRRRCAAR